MFRSASGIYLFGLKATVIYSGKKRLFFTRAQRVLIYHLLSVTIHTKFEIYWRLNFLSHIFKKNKDKLSICCKVATFWDIYSISPPIYREEVKREEIKRKGIKREEIKREENVKRARLKNKRSIIFRKNVYLMCTLMCTFNVPFIYLHFCLTLTVWGGGGG